VALVLTVVAVVLLPMEVEGMVGGRKTGKLAKEQEPVVAEVVTTNQKAEATAAAKGRMVFCSSSGQSRNSQAQNS